MENIKNIQIMTKPDTKTNEEILILQTNMEIKILDFIKKTCTKLFRIKINILNFYMTPKMDCFLILQTCPNMILCRKFDDGKFFPVSQTKFMKVNEMFHNKFGQLFFNGFYGLRRLYCQVYRFIP